MDNVSEGRNMNRCSVLMLRLAVLVFGSSVAMTGMQGCGRNEATNPEKTVLRSPGSGSESIGTKRYFVRNECWYALDKSWLTKGDDPNGPGGNGTKSNWNWLSKKADANANALKFVISTYQTCVTDALPTCGCCGISSKTAGLKAPQNTESYWVDYLSSDAYGIGYEGQRYGHGCQCVTFVSMVIYRATGGMKFTWTWGGMGESSCPSAINAQPGDIVFHEADKTHIQHVAICVRNYGSGVTVVDSNVLGHEVIGRHDLSADTIKQGWKVYSGKGKWY